MIGPNFKILKHVLLIILSYLTLIIVVKVLVVIVVVRVFDLRILVYSLLRGEFQIIGSVSISVTIVIVHVVLIIIFILAFKVRRVIFITVV